MLTQDQLQVLLADLESDRVERTTSAGNTDKLAQAVCAFANDYPNHREPGYLLIGVDDKGVPSGLNVTDQLLQNLGVLRSDGNILPLPAMSVSRFVLEGGQVAVVEVRPSDMPPIRYKGQIWLRVGPREAIASEQEERILTERRVSGAHTFDATPLRDATYDDLLLSVFEIYRRAAIAPEVIAANHRSLEDQLTSLRFVDPRTGHPTVAGILMFGKRARSFLPGAYVQFLRFAGNTMSGKPIDQAEVDGDFLAVLRELDLRIKVNLRTDLEQVTLLRERLSFDYPYLAVRELLLNAVMHRDYRSNTPVRFYWYADHIEIQNSGGLYGDVTPDTLTKSNSYRNPIIAECMKSLGYINRFGYGISSALELLRDNGNPPPRFEIDDQVFRVTIYHKHAGDGG